MTKSGNPWALVLHPRVEKLLVKLERRDLKRIDRALLELKDDPLMGDTHLLQAEDGIYRKHIGDWRIFFCLDRERRHVLVIEIDRRSSTTY